MKKQSTVLRMLAFSAALIFLCSVLPLFSSCRKGMEDLKICVLREDDSSGEAAAWEKYLRDLAGEYGFTVDFTTTDSSSSEVSAINTYASKGYDAVMLFSDDDIVASVNAAAAKRMYVVCPTGHPTEGQITELRSNTYYLGSVAPDADTEYAAGYAMAKFFVEEKGQTAFTIFGGATSYGVVMHVQRLAGMLAYLCEDSGTSYAGKKDRAGLAAAISGAGVDPAKFTSTRYRITGYMDGFAFDDAFSTKLTNSMESGGVCILSVGAGEVVSKIAYGIISSNARIPSFTSGGVDAITSEYASCFDLGYTYDCGKFASSMAPGIILILNAVNGRKILDDDGFAPKISMNYWTATSKASLLGMLASDNPTDGYCYDRAVIDRYLEGSYADLLELCSKDYEGAIALHDAAHAEGGDAK